MLTKKVVVLKSKSLKTICKIIVSFLKIERQKKGEREYLDDAGLKAGAEKAQKDVAEYCKG